MAKLVRVDRLQRDAYLLLFRDAERQVTAWFASPRLSKLLRNPGLDAVSDAVLSSFGVDFSLATCSLSLRPALKGGGCTLSGPGGVEPPMPTTSVDQVDAQAAIKHLHDSQSLGDFQAAFEASQLISDFAKKDVDHPFAVFRTLVESFTSLDWSGQVCTCWVLERITQLLYTVYLKMMFERQAVSTSTKQYLKQLLDIMLKDVERPERLNVYLQCYQSVLIAGINAIACTEFPVDEALRGQLRNTLRLLSGVDISLSDILPYDSPLYTSSTFHLALSVEVAGKLAANDTQSVQYLIALLQGETVWAVRYLAMLKLAEVIPTLELPWQKKIIEGEPPSSQGFVQLLETTAGESSWRTRIAAYHSCLLASSNCAASEVKSMLDTAADGLRSMETDPRVKDFMRQTLTVQKLANPQVEDYCENPTQYMMTLLPTVGKAHLAHIESRSASLFEKEFFHPSARVVVTKTNIAIVTGGVEHPSHTYEIALDSGEYLRMAELAEGRGNHSIALMGNTVVVTGGREVVNTLSSTEAYAGGKWELSAPLRKPRESHNCVVANRTMYVVGGTGSEDVGCTVEVLREGQWIVLAARLPESRILPALVFTTPTCLLVAGGKNQKLRKDVWQLHIETGTVQSLPKLPTSSAFPSNPACVTNGFVCLLSCEAPELLQLDLIDMSWTVLGEDSTR